MLVFSLLSIPALRTVALPPSSGTMTPQGLQDQNSPSGETAEGFFMAWSQHSKGQPPWRPTQSVTACSNFSMSLKAQ